MRESINGAWFFGIVLTFMAIFIAYISITFNYRSAFEVKNNIVDIIEKNNGLNKTSKDKIEAMLKASNYKSKGKCPGKTGTYYGVTEGHATRYMDEASPKAESYCVYREESGSGDNKKYYYEVYVFFNFSLPVVGDLFSFKVNGTTGVVHYPYEDEIHF